MSSWIGVDLDGVLAHYDGDWKGESIIGAPIPAMVERVKHMLKQGHDVRIFTARVAGHGMMDIATGKPIDALTPIYDWCLVHIGQKLPVTNVKDYGMIELYDDRAIQVVPNQGTLATKLAYERGLSDAMKYSNYLLAT